MAIIPTYQNLTPYTQALAVRRANQQSPLDALLQGAQQGLKLQQLPQQIQDQELARQLNNALLTQKLNDLQNPEQAIARKIQEELTIKGALNPDLGITRAEPGLVGQTIFNPGAITAQQQAALPSAETLALRETALNQAGVPSPAVVLPTAEAGAAERPISAFGIQTGLNTNPNIREQAAQDKLDNQIKLANARVRSSGVQGSFIPDGYGGMIFAQKPTEAGGSIATTRINTPEGPAVKVAPKGGGKGGSALTPNQQASLMFKYGQVRDIVGSTDDPKFQDASGNLDYNKLAIEVGNAERSQKLADLSAKEKSLNSAQKKEIGSFISAQKDLENLKAKIIDLDAKGEEPGFFQNGLAVVANNPSEGWFSSAIRQFANSQLNESTIQKESVRAGLESAVTKALSGQAVSAGEAQRLTGLLPKADDTFKIMLTKLAGLEDFLNNRVEGTREAAAGGPAPTSTSSGMTRIVTPNGQELDIPTNNVGEALKRGAKVK